MVLCPIAIVASCKKCPVFTICPLKSVIGDYRKPDKAQTQKDANKVKKGIKRKM